MAQNADKLYVELYFGQLIPTVQFTPSPKRTLTPYHVCSEQRLATETLLNPPLPQDTIQPRCR